jgi:hypothetical protein
MIIVPKIQIFLIITIIYKVKLVPEELLLSLTQEFLLTNLMMGLRDLLAACPIGWEEVAGLRF